MTNVSIFNVLNKDKTTKMYFKINSLFGSYVKPLIYNLHIAIPPLKRGQLKIDCFTYDPIISLRIV